MEPRSNTFLFNGIRFIVEGPDPVVAADNASTIAALLHNIHSKVDADGSRDYFATVSEDSFSKAHRFTYRGSNVTVRVSDRDDTTACLYVHLINDSEATLDNIERRRRAHVTAQAISAAVVSGDNTLARGVVIASLTDWLMSSNRRE